MRSGSLRHRVRLQREQITPSTGGDGVSYLDVATLSAEVTTSGGREFWDAKRLMPELTHQVEIRFFSGITAGMRFVFGAQVLRVVSPMDPDNRRVRLLCMCRELVEAAA
jgi:SPP1 family predicted phage head-tail adaptor